MQTHEEPAAGKQFLKDGKNVHVIGELWQFVRATGKWWLVPILVVLLLLGIVIVLSGTGYAPFLYTLF